MVQKRAGTILILCWLIVEAGIFPASAASQLRTFTLAETRLRDPFILADQATQTYYLVTSSVKPADLKANAVSVLTSKDLQTWTGPYPIFEIGPDFWAQGHIWAPEMHRHGGKYYLFATMNGSRRLPDEPWPDWPEKTARGTQVLVADSPMGPFRPFANRSHTDPNLMALDGTLWVEDGVPYMVYCHEWVQIKDGTIDLVRLRDDLSGAAGPPITLFKASQAPLDPRRPGPVRHRWAISLPDLDGKADDDLVQLHRQRVHHRRRRLHIGSGAGSLGPPAQPPLPSRRRPRDDLPGLRRAPRAPAALPQPQSRRTGPPFYANRRR